MNVYFMQFDSVDDVPDVLMAFPGDVCKIEGVKPSKEGGFLSLESNKTYEEVESILKTLVFATRMRLTLRRIAPDETYVVIQGDKVHSSQHTLVLLNGRLHQATVAPDFVEEELDKYIPF